MSPLYIVDYINQINKDLSEDMTVLYESVAALPKEDGLHVQWLAAHVKTEQAHFQEKLTGLIKELERNAS